MIADVRLDGFTCAELPAKFEAGTPPITEAVGLGAALDFLTGLGMAESRRHEIDLAGYAIGALQERYGDDITIHGPTNLEVRGATLSFAFRGIHPHDISQVLDQANVYVRAGHHCAKPAHARYGVQSSTRMSSYLYTTPAEIDALVDGLGFVRDYFGSR